ALRSFTRCGPSVISPATATRAAIYTLEPIPQFDSKGLWRYRQIGFSSQGTLRATLIHLVETSPAGQTHTELQDLLHLRVHDTLRLLVRARELQRKLFQDVYVYLSAKPKPASRQWAERPKREPPEACAVCGGRMNVQKTIQRWGKTLAHGLFRVRETIYACASRRKQGHRVVTARSSFLAQLLLPHSTVGYDLLVYVGCQRFVHYRQREEIRAAL